MTAPSNSLDQARQELGLSLSELWLRYFALGGMTSALEVEAILYGALAATRHDHDVLAHALNERFTELGRNHPVQYSEDVDAEGAGEQP